MAGLAKGLAEAVISAISCSVSLQATTLLHLTLYPHHLKEIETLKKNSSCTCTLG